MLLSADCQMHAHKPAVLDKREGWDFHQSEVNVMGTRATHASALLPIDSSVEHGNRRILRIKVADGYLQRGAETDQQACPLILRYVAVSEPRFNQRHGWDAKPRSREREPILARQPAGS